MHKIVGAHLKVQRLWQKIKGHKYRYTYLLN